MCEAQDRCPSLIRVTGDAETAPLQGIGPGQDALDGRWAAIGIPSVKSCTPAPMRCQRGLSCQARLSMAGAATTSVLPKGSMTSEVRAPQG